MNWALMAFSCHSSSLSYEDCLEIGASSRHLRNLLSIVGSKPWRQRPGIQSRLRIVSTTKGELKPWFGIALPYGILHPSTGLAPGIFDKMHFQAQHTVVLRFYLASVVSLQ